MQIDKDIYNRTQGMCCLWKQHQLIHKLKFPTLSQEKQHRESKAYRARRKERSASPPGIDENAIAHFWTQVDGASSNKFARFLRRLIHSVSAAIVAFMGGHTLFEMLFLPFTQEFIGTSDSRDGISGFASGFPDKPLEGEDEKWRDVEVGSPWRAKTKSGGTLR